VTPGCISARWGAQVVVEEKEERELEREVRRGCCWEAKDASEGVRGEGGSKRVGEESTTGGGRMREEERVTVSGRVDRARALLLEPGGALMFGTSTGKRAGRAGRSAFLRMLRVKTGIAER
jgi:hypothetical protein